MWSTIYTTITKNKLAAGIACLVIIAYLLPYYILGEDTHIRVHDNLDSNIVWYKLLAESGQIFTLSDVALPNVINGLPRSALPSGFDAMVWLYILFEPMTAYAIGQTIMRFAAFFGMYLLLRHHFLREEKFTLIQIGAALGFALLPYWPSGMLSIAGLPLALHLLLTIRKRRKDTPIYYWIVLLIIPFFSNFVLTFVFFLGVMGLLWLIDWIRMKSVNWVFFNAIAAMTFIYLVKNYLLITSMFFDNDFRSHREELSLGHNTFQRSLELSVENFLYDHTHDMAEHYWVIVPVIGIAFLIASVRNLKPYMLLGLFIFNAALSVWYAFWYWEGLRVIKDTFSIANTFNFSRIHFFDPAIWYICFALALGILWKHLPFGKWIVAILIVIQCSIVFQLNEEAKYSKVDSPTFKEFYSEELFDEIEDYIGRDQSEYRIVSIGMHPTIAQFNGFYTLDTYNNSFSLDYKHSFKEVIQGELDKNASLERYFDTWGGRLYMYIADHGEDYMFTKERDGAIEELSISKEALVDLGGDFIFSAVPIENYKELGLEFEKSFEKDDLPWEVRVYRVD
ncbi:DUF6044 family protein [Virgibacillus sp. C22-A2]|uniref:DUF6044 family protein n=1 Tax=Virgibacillus tibetensis TaxID=3042313 RepID=A0ABU6KD29_9BACI|nr:DUF6044 family protein [Virgibacillus sp. C22-A2]